MDASNRQTSGLNTGAGQVNNMLTRYAELGWQLVSGDMGYDPARGKKTFNFHSRSWRDDPVCRPDSTGYALKTGEGSGVMAIDLDDPTLPHNQKLMDLCERAGGIKQTTRKGVHYLFRNDDRLRTTTNEKLKLDIRNANALLYVEPSHYDVDGRTQFYKVHNLPTNRNAVPVCPDEVVDYIQTLFRPNLSTAEKKTIRDTVKRENSGMDKLRVDMSKAVEDVRTLLQNIAVEHAENYADWIKVGLALHHEGLNWELWDEFSRRSPKYREGEPYYVWQTLATRPTDEPISIRTLYWWLKSENEQVFQTLINKDENEEYLRMKLEFERNTFVVGARIIRIQENGRHTVLTNGDAMVMFANQMFRKWEDGKMVKQNFYYWWLRDSTRRQYERMDFIPPPMDCPDSVYNLYHGFAAEGLPEVDPAEVEDLIRPILQHVNYLTSGDPSYFLAWFANLVQTPSRKSETAIVLRDESQLLKEGGGTGKNLFLEWFARFILGEDYFAIVSNNSELFNPFNEHLEHKLLVFVEEAQAKANGKEIDQLKAMVTRKMVTINRKGVPKYEQYDFARYVFASNNTNPISSQGASPSDRRFAYYDVDRSKRGDTDYFANLSKAMADPRVQRAFYDYLKTCQTYETPIEFQNHRPVTAAFLDIRRMNADPILRWVIHRVENDRAISGESSSLFADFQDWMTQRHEVRTEENRYSLTRFVQYLTKNCDLTRPPPESAERGLYKSNTSHIELSTERLREELIRCQYLRPTAAQVFADEPVVVDPVAQKVGVRRRVVPAMFLRPEEVATVTVPTLDA
jgi:hypothetical protein